MPNPNPEATKAPTHRHDPVRRAYTDHGDPVYRCRACGARVLDDGRPWKLGARYA